MKQAQWRLVGGICLACCGGMALFGVKLKASVVSPWVFLGYWTLFLLLFLVTLFCVLIDLRYIRAERAIMERNVFMETLGDEEFRRALREAQSKAAERNPTKDRSDS